MESGYQPRRDQGWWPKIGRIAHHSRGAVFIAANSFVIWHLLTTHVGTVALTEGPSMLPTLRSNGDWIVQDRIWPTLTSNRYLKRGMLITYTSPVDRTRQVCKRLIGLPGDIIRVGYDPKTGKVQHTIVPPNHFWTQGDNKTTTLDSNTYGPVPFGLFLGQVRAIVSFWPFRFQRVTTTTYID